MNINLTASIIEKGQTIGVTVSNLIAGAAWSTSYFSCPNHFITSNHNGSETITGVNGGGTNLSGTVTFYAYKADGTTFLGSCSASFTVTPIKAKGVSLTPTSRTFTYIGETQYLSATVSPAETFDPSLSWSSSNPAVATVSARTITAVGNGTCTITASTVDGSGLSASCSVTVSTPIPVSSITITPTTLSFNATGQSAALTVTNIAPANASNKGVHWVTSDPSVCSVGSVVTVTKTSYGSAQCTISCIADDGYGASASCVVTVNIPDPTIHVTGVSLSPSSVSLVIGQQATLTPNITPSNATNKGVSWSAQNSGIASVSSSGVVTANGVGSCYITATTSDGGYQSTCYVTVTTYNPRPVNFSYTYAKTQNQPIYSTVMNGGTIMLYIMPASEWNALTTRINEFRTYKGLGSYGFTTVSSGSDFTPTIYNQAVNAINAMGFSLSTVSSGDISAAMLNSLVTAINSIV